MSSRDNKATAIALVAVAMGLDARAAANIFWGGIPLYRDSMETILASMQISICLARTLESETFTEKAESESRSYQRICREVLES